MTDALESRRLVRWQALLLVAIASLHTAFGSNACAASAAVQDGWVDRIEGDRAVLLEVDEVGGLTQRVVILDELPIGAREGDRIVDGRIDAAATDALRRRIEVLQGLLWGGEEEAAMIEYPGDD